MLCLAEFCITLHIILYASLTLHISGSGRLSVSWSRMFLKSGQFALPKFHLFSEIVYVGWTGFVGGMSDGQCCEDRKGSSTSRQGKGPSKLTKARSGLVVVPHHGDRKLSSCLESKMKWALDAESQFSKTWPSLLVELYLHLTLCEFKSPTYIIGAFRQGVELS